jgi:hypothetical protein
MLHFKDLNCNFHIFSSNISLGKKFKPTLDVGLDLKGGKKMNPVPQINADPTHGIFSHCRQRLQRICKSLVGERTNERNIKAADQQLRAGLPIPVVYSAYLTLKSKIPEMTEKHHYCKQFIVAKKNRITKIQVFPAYPNFLLFSPPYLFLLFNIHSLHVDKHIFRTIRVCRVTNVLFLLVSHHKALFTDSLQS